MPVLTSSYKAKGLFKSGHFSTIYSAKLRAIPLLEQQRERMVLPDNDFIDLDWTFTTTSVQKVALLLHGLEGNAQRVYIKAQAKWLIKEGWDVCAVNLRGCSEEVNHSFSCYNAGKSEDLAAVIEYILQKDRYNEMALIGFSLGGNLLLKYLGERSFVPSEIKKAIAVSTPLNLKGSLEALNQFHNKIYSTSFLLDLRKKYKLKMNQFPDKLSVTDLKKINSLYDFDTLYTAPANGFADAEEYYEKSSSLQFIPAINIPVLILNAQNDSFLSSDCYPYELAENSKNIYLETPKHGGHVGFHLTNKLYYSEHRTLQFLKE